VIANATIPAPAAAAGRCLSSFLSLNVLPVLRVLLPLILSLRHGLLLFSPLKKQLGGGDGTESTTSYHYQPRYIAGA